MKLKVYIESNHLTQEEFGVLVGVNQSTVARWVTGERMPRRDVLARIHEVTGGAVTANDFMAAPAPVPPSDSQPVAG